MIPTLLLLWPYVVSGQLTPEQADLANKYLSQRLRGETTGVSAVYLKMTVDQAVRRVGRDE